MYSLEHVCVCVCVCVSVWVLLEFQLLVCDSMGHTTIFLILVWIYVHLKLGGRAHPVFFLLLFMSYFLILHSGHARFFWNDIHPLLISRKLWLDHKSCYGYVPYHFFLILAWVYAHLKLSGMAHPVFSCFYLWVMSWYYSCQVFLKIIFTPCLFSRNLWHDHKSCYWNLVSCHVTRCILIFSLFLAFILDITLGSCRIFWKLYLPLGYFL